MAAPNLSFRACVHRESPLGSVLVEPQDIERAVAARELAIAVIGAEPLIEDFNDLDHASVQSESPRHGQTVRFAAVDLNAHAFASPRLRSLQPISKSPDEDNEASALYAAEEVVGVVFPTDEDAALPLNPSKEALHEPASHIAA